MTKKNLSLPLIVGLCFATTGCGVVASNAVVSPAESMGKDIVSASASSEYMTPEAASAEEASLVPIDEWEQNWKEIMDEEEGIDDDFDETQYDEKIVRSKVDDAIKSSASIAEEIESIEKIANYYNGYHFADLKQGEMNEYSVAEVYTWDHELDCLLKRILEEADESEKKSIKAEQDTWKADFDRCYKVLEYKEGTWASMQNSGLDVRFLKSRCYMLAKELSDIRGENYELPKRFYRDNAYVGDKTMLDIAEGMEGGSIAITVVLDGKEEDLLVYDPLINDNTIEFKAVSGVEGKITYGWDGATLTMTKSVNKILPKGTEIKFPTAM